jgi:hypothetical protein
MYAIKIILVDGSGTSSSGFGVDRTDKFIVVDGGNPLKNISVCLNLFVSTSHERVEGRGEGEGMAAFIVLLSLEADLVCLSPFLSVLGGIGAGEID